jgi:hypothetical protein
MLSRQLKVVLEELEIDHGEMSNNQIRLKLEDLVDSVEQLKNSKDHDKYSAIQWAYSLFMEEYTNILDKVN